MSFQQEGLCALTYQSAYVPLSWRVERVNSLGNVQPQRVLWQGKRIDTFCFG
jgi:hypothetical protein